MEKLEPILIKSFILMNKFFQEEQIRYCLIGGMAAGYWGEPRFTRDMDFTVVSQSGDLKPLVQKFRQNGFKVETKGPSQMQVVAKGQLHFQADLVLAETDYQDWVVQRAVSVAMFDINVPICSAEDLIILKLIANRRQDLLDIENVLKNHRKDLDKKYIKKWFQIWELEERFQKEFGEL